MNNDFVMTTNLRIPTNKPKSVIIALPGRTFSDNFLKAWTQTLFVLFEKKYKVTISFEYSSFVTFSRMKTLGLDVKRGPDQKPFNGMIDYDVWLTIDSDIVFTPEQVIELIENTDMHPVVSGLYKMQDMKHYACVKEWDEEYFIKNSTFEFLTEEYIENYKKTEKQKFITVAYNGMGFFACRKGVIEKLKYPYFYRDLQEIKDKDGNIIMIDICSEDVSFCKNLQDAGFSINVNCELRVGHEKPIIL